jgi:hypothetical protein
MKTTKIQRGFVLVTITAALTAGCELIVDFDRTRIPVVANEAAVPDGSLLDATLPGEGGSDATTDASDAGEDATDAADAATDG